MAEQKTSKTARIGRDSLDMFTRGYINAAMVTTSDENHDSFSEFDIEDISPATLQRMVDDCKKFQAENAQYLEDGDDVTAGTDFWLTRNGYGSGFWDGDWKHKDKLTFNAKKLGQVNLFLGEDGYVYQEGVGREGTIPPKDDLNVSSDYDKTFMKRMGITALFENKLLLRKDLKMAHTFEDTERQYDYEANGMDAILISPANTTKHLVEEDAIEFWKKLDAIEEEVLDSEAHTQKVQDLVSSYFSGDINAVY